MGGVSGEGEWCKWSGGRGGAARVVRGWWRLGWGTAGGGEDDEMGKKRDAR